MNHQTGGFLYSEIPKRPIPSFSTYRTTEFLSPRLFLSGLREVRLRQFSAMKRGMEGRDRRSKGREECKGDLHSEWEVVCSVHFSSAIGLDL